MSRPFLLASLLVSGLAAAQPPATDERLDTLTGRLDALEEQYSETKTSMLSMQRLKLSGYVQARYTNLQGSHSGVDASGAPLVKDGFTVRRGRLKATYTAPYSQFVLQIDATPSGLALKDAEAHFFEPWTGQKLELIAGQTKWPFGYEVVQSSGDREFPERTRVVRAFANGERDRGAKLAWKKGIWRATAGVFDGNGTANKGFSGVDNDTEKDLVGRLGV
ncbi:MAG: porin, partial [Myxococcaceae bacterium]